MLAYLAVQDPGAFAARVANQTTVLGAAIEEVRAVQGVDANRMAYVLGLLQGAAA